ncbi:HhH-GPD family protein [Paenibacillus xanthanilyticus]|uniref:Adenine DNA glycosylase n=1 Tax=Paenibacillus xanthanilyticus TaxID=1783531 RepID=A0ABV8K891_9BACL
MNEIFWEKLLNWYAENGRHQYPWRTTNDPYHILVAEFLLQQTHVRKVEEVYKQILHKYVDIKKLSNADVSELENIIAPLGLKYRATRLILTAKEICIQHAGEVPSNYNDLIQLPGIGDYIANAILCYAYGQPVVPIDTNVIRLFTRFFGYTSNNTRPRVDKVLASKIRDHFKGFKSTRSENLAILDFAGLVCIAKKPHSKECPLAQYCDYFNSRDKDDILG